MTALMTKRQVAEHLGITIHTLRRRLPDMRRAGFPEPDPVMQRYLTADVEAWIASRARIAQHGPTETPEINYHAL